MRLIYAPQSPVARKVRAAAIELGRGDSVQLEYAEVAPLAREDDAVQATDELRSAGQRQHANALPLVDVWPTERV